MPDPARSESTQPDSISPASSRWLVRLPVADRVDHLADLNADLMRNGMPSRRGRILLAVARLAVTFAIGVGITLAWQPYGDAARTMIAKASPQLGWLAPVAVAAPSQPRSAGSPSDLEVVRERIDRLAASQEQVTRSVALLTAGQERIAEEIGRVREVEEYLLYKTSYKGAEAAPARPPVTTSAHRGRRSVAAR